MIKNAFALLALTAILGCGKNVTKKDVAIEKADSLWNDVANGTASKHFPEKYFPPNETILLLADLQNKCDFRNRRGHFINEFYSDDEKRISLIYEYYMRCDSVRFILTFNIYDRMELYEFKVEPIEKENYMITKPEKRLEF